MATKIKRGSVTVSVSDLEVENLISNGWSLVDLPPEPGPQPAPVPKPVKEPQPAPVPKPVKEPQRSLGPGFGYKWPPEAPKVTSSRREWAEYARTLGVDPAFLNRGELQEAVINVLEGQDQ